MAFSPSSDSQVPRRRRASQLSGSRVLAMRRVWSTSCSLLAPVFALTHTKFPRTSGKERNNFLPKWFQSSTFAADVDETVAFFPMAGVGVRRLLRSSPGQVEDCERLRRHVFSTGQPTRNLAGLTACGEMSNNCPSSLWQSQRNKVIRPQAGRVVLASVPILFRRVSCIYGSHAPLTNHSQRCEQKAHAKNRDCETMESSCFQQIANQKTSRSSKNVADGPAAVLAKAGARRPLTLPKQGFSSCGPLTGPEKANKADGRQAESLKRMLNSYVEQLRPA